MLFQLYLPYTARCPVKRSWALLRSNPTRDSRVRAGRISASPVASRRRGHFLSIILFALPYLKKPDPQITNTPSIYPRILRKSHNLHQRLSARGRCVRAAGSTLGLRPQRPPLTPLIHQPPLVTLSPVGRNQTSYQFEFHRQKPVFEFEPDDPIDPGEPMPVEVQLAREKASEKFQEELNAWRSRVSEPLGALSERDGEVVPRRQSLLARRRRAGTTLEITLFGLERAVDGVPAIVRWPAEQGCTDMKYTFFDDY
jgi:hypothetical protein